MASPPRRGRTGSQTIERPLRARGVRPQSNGRVGSMRIALGSDHAGYELKTLLKSSLESWGYEVLDLGTDSASEPVDYPDYGAAVGRAVVSHEAELGSRAADRDRHRHGGQQGARRSSGRRARRDVRAPREGAQSRQRAVPRVVDSPARPSRWRRSTAWLRATPEARHERANRKAARSSTTLARIESR